MILHGRRIRETHNVYGAVWPAFGSNAWCHARFYAGFGHSACKASLKVRTESEEIPKTDSLADFPHEVKVKVDVMEGGEGGAENFA